LCDDNGFFRERLTAAEREFFTRNCSVVEEGEFPNETRN